MFNKSLNLSDFQFLYGRNGEHNLFIHWLIELDSKIKKSLLEFLFGENI